MSNNVAITPGTGVTISTDEVTTFNGVSVNAQQVQNVKPVFGPQGSASDITAATPLPIVDSLLSPISKWVTITPSDTTVLIPAPASIYINGAGNITLTGSDGVSATFTVPAGSLLPCRPSKVNATGTTATGIIAFNY